MVVDLQAAKFFGKQMEDPENNVCCDSSTEGADWASISHGIYLSIAAAALHRSLGVKVSFVQSTTMDSLKPKHLRMMELGGNRRFNEFLKEQGIPLDMPIREKYSTQAAEWYREDLRARAEGLAPLAPLPPGTGHLPANISHSSMKHVLDKVFAESSCKGSVTNGYICQGEASLETSEEVIDKAKTKSICETLSACFRLRWHSSEAPQSSKSLAHEGSLTTLLGPARFVFAEKAGQVTASSA